MKLRCLRARCYYKIRWRVNIETVSVQFLYAISHTFPSRNPGTCPAPSLQEIRCLDHPLKFYFEVHAKQFQFDTVSIGLM